MGVEVVPSLDNLVEKVMLIAERSSAIASTKLGEIESSISSLIEGSITSAQLVDMYGKLSPLERDRQIHDLDQVRNAIAVQIEKEKVNQSAIRLQKEKATTVFTGLKAAFELQTMAEKTMDEKQEAEYEGEKRLLNEADRQSELAFKSDRNKLTQTDRDNRIDHQAKVNQISESLRMAVRTKLSAIADRKTAQAERAKSS